MQIVIPMAGSGQRFRNVGYKEIKPLIQIEGKPMIEHVINLFPDEHDFVFICSKQHLKTTQLQKILRKLKPTATIATIDPHKLGPVETVLRAKEYIQDNESVIINYCDFSMNWEFEKFKNKVKNEKVDGALVCYTGFHPHLLGDNLYAGVKTDENGVFLETKEKYSYTVNKMDSWHSTGTYYFRTGAIAKMYLEQVKKEKLLTKGEYYIPWAYNFMKRDHLKIIVYPAKYFCQWGTPQDLEAYLYWSRYFHHES